MDSRLWAATNLAARLLARPWTLPLIEAAIVAHRAAPHPRTRAALVVRVFALGEERYPPSSPTLVAHLLASDFFKPDAAPRAPVVLDPPCFAPSAAFAGLAVPPIATPGALAVWLGLSAFHLEWLSDTRRSHARAATTALQNYRYAVVARSVCWRPRSRSSKRCNGESCAKSCKQSPCIPLRTVSSPAAPA